MTRAPATADCQRIGRGHEVASRQEPAVGDAGNVAAIRETTSQDVVEVTSGVTGSADPVWQRRALDMLCD